MEGTHKISVGNKILTRKIKWYIKTEMEVSKNLNIKISIPMTCKRIIVKKKHLLCFVSIEMAAEIDENSVIYTLNVNNHSWLRPPNSWTTK